MSRNFIESICVEYDDIPIRHCLVRCSSCKNWFLPADVCGNPPAFTSDLWRMEFECPICKETIGYDQETTIHETDCENFPKPIRPQTTWE